MLQSVALKYNQNLTPKLLVPGTTANLTVHLQGEPGSHEWNRTAPCAAYIWPTSCAVHMQHPSATFAELASEGLLAVGWRQDRSQPCKKGTGACACRRDDPAAQVPGGSCGAALPRVRSGTECRVQAETAARFSVKVSQKRVHYCTLHAVLRCWNYGARMRSCEKETCCTQRSLPTTQTGALRTALQASDSGDTKRSKPLTRSSSDGPVCLLLGRSSAACTCILEHV